MTEKLNLVLDINIIIAAFLEFGRFKSKSRLTKSIRFLKKHKDIQLYVPFTQLSTFRLFLIRSYPEYYLKEIENSSLFFGDKASDITLAFYSFMQIKIVELKDYYIPFARIHNLIDD